MNNNDVENRLKTDVGIPESLKPENIEKKLEKIDVNSTVPVDPVGDGTEFKEEKKKKNIFWYSLAAAAVLICVVGFSVLGMKVYKAVKELDKKMVANNEIFSTTESTAVSECTTEAAPQDSSDQTAAADSSVDEDSNYHKAYTILSAYQSQYTYYDDVEYAVEEGDDVVYEAESADGATFSLAGNDTAKYTTEAAREENHDYTETNVRTQGVDEGDIVKTDGEYIYSYVADTETINIYKVDEGKFSMESFINVTSDIMEGRELYINGDRLIFLGNSDYNYYGDLDLDSVTAIYDISDRKNPKELEVLHQDGYLSTSRLVDGILYTFSYKYVYTNDCEEDDIETYIPQVEDVVIADEDLVVPETSYSNGYVVATSVKVDDAKYVQKHAFMVPDNTLYMSTDNIYFSVNEYDWRNFSYMNSTRILKVSYDEGRLQVEGQGAVPGNLHDDYSIDEYDGYLRLVTTYYNNGTYNALYILDGDLKRVSVIKRIAEGEEIQSARFMGDKVFFVTFRNTDPLFSVDLSNPNKPEIVGFLELPGFSAYLHPYSENLLLGIGYEGDSAGLTGGIKMSMFDISDASDVKEIDKYVIEDADMASVIDNPNTLMHDKKDGYIGFAVSGYMDSETKYMVYDYEDGFDEKLEFRIPNSSWDEMAYLRGVVIDGYLYVIREDKMVSFDTENFSVIQED